MALVYSTDFDPATQNVAVLPIGSFEQHGAHLPCDTDARIASIIGGRVSEQLDAALLGVLPVATSHEHSAFAGTVSVSASVCDAYVRATCEGLKKAGFDSVVLINGHGGNYWLSNLVQELNEHQPWVLLGPSKAVMTRAFELADLSLDVSGDMHAGEYETSVLLAAAPDVVRADRIKDEMNADRPMLSALGMAAYTTSGVIGRPSMASAAKGSALLAALVGGIVEEFSAMLEIRGSV